MILVIKIVCILLTLTTLFLVYFSFKAYTAITQLEEHATMQGKMNNLMIKRITELDKEIKKMKR